MQDTGWPVGTGARVVRGVNSRGDSLVESQSALWPSQPCRSLLLPLSRRPFVPLRRQQPRGSSSLERPHAPPTRTQQCHCCRGVVSSVSVWCASSAHAGFMSWRPRTVLVLYYPPSCLRRRSAASASCPPPRSAQAQVATLASSGERTHCSRRLILLFLHSSFTNSSSPSSTDHYCTCAQP